MKPRLSRRLVRHACRGPVALVLAGSVLAAPLAAAGATSAVAPSRPAADCAWPQMISADTSNHFLPDSAAVYWVTQFDVHSELRIAVSGQYPDSRYASLNVYGGSGGSFTTNGVSSGLADHQIAPEPGSRNPWQEEAAPGGRFTVTLRADVAPGQVNALPLAPANTADGTRGFLIYRVYLPAGGSPSSVVLPTLTFTRDGESVTLPPCPAGSRARDDDEETLRGMFPGTPIDGTLDGAAGTRAGPIAFARPTEEEGGGVFPNTDNAYLRAWVTPPRAGKVVVIRAKAPRAVSGEHPAPWPQAGKDMRYWSMCTNLEFPLLPVVVNRLPDGSTDYGCRHDELTRVDASGSYAYVIGTERQRAAIERVPGVTFLPFSTTQPHARHLVLLRNMLPVGDFAHAVQNVPRDGNPDSAAAVMGHYYPRATECALSALAAGGPDGCG